MRAKQLSLFLLVAGLPLASSDCGGDNLTLPSEGEPARIAVYDGGDQNGRVGSRLEESLTVQVTDTRGRPVPGASVEFVLEDGSGGTAFPASVMTSDSGLARTSITLGTQVGPVTGLARVPVEAGQTPIETQFAAIAHPADANGIFMVSGEQNGPVGTPLPAPLVVQVTDGFGNPISGIRVEWSVSGGGDVSATSTETGANGQTSVQRTLGPTAGLQTTSASAQSASGEDLVGSPVVFNHTATAGSAARVTAVSGDGQQGPPGTQLRDELVVQVLDAENNPIVDRAVTWVIGTGEGSVNPVTSNTNAEGRASTRWTLGPQPGRNTLSAVVSGVGFAPFNATGTKTPSTTTIAAHQPEPSTIGQAVEVRVDVTGSGGTPTGTVTVSGENAEPCTITLSNGSGACNLTFTSNGQQRITATYNGDTRFNGSSDSENHQVNAANAAPSAAFSPPTCVATQPCQFTDESGDSDGSVVAWTWDFGDEQGSDQRNPQHTYASPNTYNVKLTVRDDDGATSEVTHPVIVNPAPVINNPPVAVADNYSTPAGQDLSVDAATGVLANDTDPENNPLSVTSNTQPAHGGLVILAADGSFQYFPGVVASGTQDTFSYTVSDGTSTASATVTINIQ